MKRIIVFSVVLVFLIATFIGLYMMHAKEVRELTESTQKYRPLLESISTNITHSINTRSGSVWFYDTNDNLLLVKGLKSNETYANVATKELVAAFFPLLGKKAALSISDVIQERTTLGSIYNKLFNIDVSTKGTLSHKMLYSLAQQKLIEVDLNDKLLCAYIEENIPKNDMVAYMLNTLRIGRDNEYLLDIIVSTFGKEVDDLNATQIDYLVFKYQNPDLEVKDYLDTHPNTDYTTLGLDNSVYDSKLLSAYLLKEFINTMGSSLDSSSVYTVKTSLSQEIQTLLQQNVDDSLKGSISLSSDRGTVIEGNAIFIEHQTGFVKGFVTSRSVNKGSRGHLISDSVIGASIRACYSIVESNSYTPLSLVRVQLSSEESELVPLRTLLEDCRISEIVKLKENSNETIWELSSLISDLYVPAGSVFIEEVMLGGTTLVYKASPVEPAIQDTETYIKRLLYTGMAPDGSKRFVQRSRNLIFTVDSYLTHTIVGIAGAIATGYRNTEEDEKTLEIFSSNISNSLEGSPLESPTSSEHSGIVASQLQRTYEYNADKVLRFLEPYFLSLEGWVVDSNASREKFESAYGELLGQVRRYEEVTTEEVNTYLVDRLNEVWLAHAKDLIKFST